MTEQGPLGPVDGGAAQLNEEPRCIFRGCPAPAVTHRRMTVQIPIEADGRTVDLAEREVDAALCPAHDAMLEADLIEVRPSLAAVEAIIRPLAIPADEVDLTAEGSID